MEYNELKEMLDKLYEYYNSINDISDYLISRKKEKLEKVKIQTEKLFNPIDINPYNMDFFIEEIDEKTFVQYSQSVSTSIVESQIGRRVNLFVKERNTGLIVGFIRVNSPTIMMKPRTTYFGVNPPINKINECLINGSIIIPVQPFGYNYLGGKLLALISASNEVREIYNKKYNTNISIFETTSLYGSIKNISQYDGLEPLMKSQGETEGNKLEFPPNSVYEPMLKRIQELFGVAEYNGKLANPKSKSGGLSSAPKLKEFNKFISVLKNEIKKHSEEEYKKFNKFSKEKMMSYTKKRYYVSDYGMTNVKDVVLNDAKPIYGINKDKFNLDYIVEWWKKKAYNRWNKLQNENRLKTNLELYTNENINNIEFKIIR